MEENEGSLHQAAVILPPLTGKLDHLNSITKKAMIRGLMMDFKISWDSPWLTWWPANIPFRNVTTQPEGYQGSWSRPLEQIIRCCYEFHGLDVETYIQAAPEDTRDRSILSEELQAPSRSTPVKRERSSSESDLDMEKAPATSTPRPPKQHRLRNHYNT